MRGQKKLVRDAKYLQVLAICLMCAYTRADIAISGSYVEAWDNDYNDSIFTSNAASGLIIPADGVVGDNDDHGEFSSVEYSLSNTEFEFGISSTTDALLGDSNTYTTIHFTVTAPTDYSFSGRIASGWSYQWYQASLFDSSTGSYLFDYGTYAGGGPVFADVGRWQGTLEPGLMYEFNVEGHGGEASGYWEYDGGFGDVFITDFGTLAGEATLDFSPGPQPAVPLPTALPAGLGLLGLVAIARRWGCQIGHV